MFGKSSRSSSGNDPELFAGLDLGTSKVTVVVAEKDQDENKAAIFGVGQAASYGIRKGVIINLEQAVDSVKQAVADAENIIGQPIEDVTVSFGCGDVSCVKSTGTFLLGREPREVTDADILHVMEVAQADVAVPNKQRVLHRIPVQYSLDNNAGIVDPLGMTGTRLDVELQSIIVPTAAVQNVISCVERAGLRVSGVVIKPLASALGALKQDEAFAGAAVVDIGAGSTSVSVIYEGRILYLGVIPIGGDHITNDVASVLKLPLNKAEEIKKAVSVSVPAGGQDDVIDFMYNNRPYTIPRKEVQEIVYYRLKELCEALLCPKIRESGVPMLPSGIVLTGGVSKTEGIDVFMLETMDLPVRIAMPVDVDEMPPNRQTQEYTATNGIIRYMLEKQKYPYKYIDCLFENGQASNTNTKPKRPAFFTKSAQNQNKEPDAPRGSFVSKFLDSGKKLFDDLF